MNNITIQIGTELSGRYRVQRLLAHGGMASVYEAQDIQLHRQVAIKVLAAHLSGDPVFREKFLTEARVAAALNHPNLVNIYDLGLIYGVDVEEGGSVMVTMTLTTPHCPVAESMPGEVELRVSSVPGIRDAEVVLVWEPAWGPHKMSDEARLELGML